MEGKPSDMANGRETAPRADVKTPVVAKKEAGIVTLIIDVAGIYASL
jgi:UDP-galactose transporter B1